MLRDERTIRRWLAGDSAIPKVVVQRLKDDIANQTLPVRQFP